MIVELELSIDLPKLIEQKEAMLRVIEESNSAEDRQLLDGILNLLDAIHDQIDPGIKWEKLT